MKLLERVKELGKDSAIYGISQALSQLVGFLLLPLYTRYLTPYDYGVLAMLGLIPVFFPAFVNLGLNNAVFRFYRQQETEAEQAELVGTSHRMVVYFSSAVLIIMLLFSKQLNLWLTSSFENQTAFQVSLISSWLIALSTIPMVVLKQQRKVMQIAFRSLIGLVFNVVTTILLVVTFEMGILGAVLGTLTGSFVTTVLVINFIPRAVWFSVKVSKIKTLLTYALPFVPYFLQSVLMGIIGQFLVKEFLGLEEAGYYSIAWRFSLPLVLVLNAINNSWAAFKFDIRFGDTDPKNSYREVFSIYICFVAICWLSIAVWMPEILNLFLAEEFYVAAKYIPFLALIPVLQNTRGMLTTGFEMSKNPKWVPLVTTLGLVTLIVASFYLKKYGVEGIILSILLGWLVTAISTFVYSYIIYPINYNWMLVFGIVLLYGFLFLTEIQVMNSITKTLSGCVGVIILYMMFEKVEFLKKFKNKFKLF